MKRFTLLFAWFTLGFSHAVFSQNSFCDSVEISSVMFNPFNDSLINVNLNWQASNFVSYPGFMLFDDNGDTIAREQVNFFGIPMGEAHHVMITYPNNYQQGSVFNGTLELWSDSYSQLECSWSISEVLKPGTGCTELILTASNFLLPWLNQTISAEIVDFDGNAVAVFSHAYDSVHQDFVDTVCLLPGCYTLRLNTTQSLPVDYLNYNLTQPWWNSNGVMEQLTLGMTSNSSDFTVFSDDSCGAVQGIGPVTGNPDLFLVNEPGNVILKSGAGTSSVVGLFMADLNGKMHLQISKAILPFRIKTDQLPEGIYFLRMIQGHSAPVTIKFSK